MTLAGMGDAQYDRGFVYQRRSSRVDHGGDGAVRRRSVFMHPSCTDADSPHTVVRVWRSETDDG